MYKINKIKAVLVLMICALATNEGMAASEFFGAFGRVLRSSSKLISVSGVKHYYSPVFSPTDLSNAPATFSSRRFMSHSVSNSLLNDPSIQNTLRKINGNCLKEIAARGSDDFVDKSYRVVHLLKISLERGASIDGQGGLADAESDWFAAWKDQKPGQQEALKGPYKEILTLVNSANEYFYGIEPDLS